jgi:alanyl aminopeptidase
MLKQRKPEWHAEIDDLRDKLAAANVDGLASARRITQPVESKSDIANAFDDITYLKGGAVIGMFEASVGPEKFRRGVQNYLRAHAYKNGRTEDFLAALSAATTPATGPAFHTFLNQPGIPEVTVAIRCDEGSRPIATLTQKRSQPLGSELEAEIWQIPVCLKFGSGAEHGQQCMIVKQKTSEVTLSAARACPEWVLPNAGSNGYYRVNYPSDSLRRLLERGGDKLSVVERASVLGDALALTMTGELGVVPLMVNSPERELVEGAQRIVNGLGTPTLPETLQANQARFIQKTFGPRARELGWIGKAEDSEDTRLLREGLVRFVALRGEDEVLASAARDVAIKWLKNRNSLNRGMVRHVLAAAAFEGDRDLFDQFRAAALETKDQEERQTLLMTMGSFRTRDIAQLALQELLTNDFDLRLSSAILVGNMTTYEETRRMPFEFARSHFDELIAKAPSFGDLDFGAVLPFTAQNFCSAQEEQEVNAFFAPRVGNLTGGPRNLAQTLEKIRACTARKARQEASLTAFYQQF